MQSVEFAAAATKNNTKEGLYMEHNQIGDKIRELRTRSNLTQADLGKLVGVSMQAVSKWERGGTPDIDVLLSVAKYFNISLDEMVGRTVNSTGRLEDVLYTAMQEVPEHKKIQQACRYCWAIFKGMSSIPGVRDYDYSTAHPGDTESSRCRVSTDEGIGYFFAAQDAPMMAIMPEPKDGYDMALGDVKDYVALFRLLGDEDAMRLFLFLCTRTTLFSERLAAQSTGIVEEKVGQVLDEFECRGWLAKETADMDDGPVLLYRPTYKEYFIFFLFFARDMTVSPQFWYLSNCTRLKAPLLRDLPADARAEH